MENFLFPILVDVQVVRSSNQYLAAILEYPLQDIAAQQEVLEPILATKTLHIHIHGVLFGLFAVALFGYTNQLVCGHPLLGLLLLFDQLILEVLKHLGLLIESVIVTTGFEDHSFALSLLYLFAAPFAKLEILHAQMDSIRYHASVVSKSHTNSARVQRVASTIFRVLNEIHNPLLNLIL